MKTNRSTDDGIEWLRELRRRIAKECDHSLGKQSTLYRKAAAKHSYKVYQEKSHTPSLKNRFKLAA